MQLTKKLFAVLLLGVVALGLLGADGCEKTESRKQNERRQEEISLMATQAEPAYAPTNFLARHYVNEYMKRMDTPSKMFYIYTKNYQGDITAFYTARSFPLSVCTLLTPPDREVDVEGPNPLGAAPSLEGTYQGGKCGNVFFFDAATNAYIELSDREIYNVSDQPLSFPGSSVLRPVQVQKPNNSKGTRVPAPRVE